MGGGGLRSAEEGEGLEALAGDADAVADELEVRLQRQEPPPVGRELRHQPGVGL